MNEPLSKYYGKMRSRPNPGSSESLLSVPEDNQGCFCDPQKNRHFKRQKSSGAVPENNDPSVDYEAEVLRRAMNQLSFAERETANRVVRGDSIIAQTILDRRRSSTQGLAEGNAFLSLKFQELDVHIRNSTTKLGFEAYQMARTQNEDYVDNPNFKIGFLRAERYNTLKAAHRLLLHFQEKLELFGPEKLTKDIEWDDLCEVAKWYHQHAGGVQLLPKRDKAGRLVVIMADVLQGRTEGKLLGIVSTTYHYCMRSAVVASPRKHSNHSSMHCLIPLQIWIRDFFHGIHREGPIFISSRLFRNTTMRWAGSRELLVLCGGSTAQRIRIQKLFKPTVALERLSLAKYRPIIPAISQFTSIWIPSTSIQKGC